MTVYALKSAKLCFDFISLHFLRKDAFLLLELFIYNIYNIKWENNSMLYIIIWYLKSNIYAIKVTKINVLYYNDIASNYALWHFIISSIKHKSCTLRNFTIQFRSKGCSNEHSKIISSLKKWSQASASN